MPHSQHYWAIHDAKIRRKLRPLSARLEALREREAKIFDAGSLYSTILNFVNDIKYCSAVLPYYHYGQIAKCLFLSGPDYYDYAAVSAEQGLSHGNTIFHPNICDICAPDMGLSDIRGARFVCLNCICTDLCADCYSSWEKSDGEMEFCKGHTFYEIPRACRYQLGEGVVMEDGSTLLQVVDTLEEKFTVLLESIGS